MAGFAELTPDAVLTAVEQAAGMALAPLATPLASYVNRVYELETRSRERLIAKFYRPGRWSAAALREEHAFVRACAAAELPVIAPLEFGGTTLQCAESGIFFALYPKRGGRRFEANCDEDWVRLGRLLARMHLAGETLPPVHHRVRMTPQAVTAQAIRRLAADPEGAGPGKRRWLATAAALVEAITPEFEQVELTVCHGDCHAGNILERPETGLMLIDFDDMCLAPAIQDAWLLLPDAVTAARPELDWLLAGYEEFRDIDYAQWRLIEPLRAMRMIYFLDWCDLQRGDFRFQESHPDWGSEPFWQRETANLLQQKEEIDSLFQFAKNN